MNINLLFEEMEHYAKENNVPIMLKEGINYLTNFVKEKNIKNILEVGTAIGYSTIKLRNEGCSITSIERDIDRYEIAKDNVKKSGFDNINLIFGDALDVEISNLYDLIFIDAAKGKNILFFEKFKNNLKEDGTIITDNLSFHGLVEDESKINTKNQRGIVNKIKNFIEFLDNNKEFITTYIPVGDKIAISKRRRCNE